MQRILFKKGKQREFLNLVIESTGCISLRGILQFGFSTNYSSLKNYYCERRLLPKDFFESLCHIAKIDMNKLRFSYLEDNWGQVKGGKRKKRNE
ncbi:MAG: hypothetical protein WC438_02355 [Candidatus Pacearchaeota archaeon]